MPHSVAVEEYMQHDPVTVGTDANIFEAIHEIYENKVSGLCVVEKDGTLVGVLSELDCLKAVLGGTYYDGGAPSVSEFMTTDLLTVSPRENIVDIATDMLERKQRRRPVVVDGKLVGLLTCRQILHAVNRFSALAASNG